MEISNDPAERVPLLAEQSLRVSASDPASSTIAITSAPCPNIDKSRKYIQEENIARVLPIAFAAAFAIAATSATTIYAYASITCEDAAHCKDKEQDRYAGVVAIATTIANVCGVAAVGILQHWVKADPEMGLSVWLVSRGTGVAILAIGVLFKSIHLAILGRIFDGFASDNILHYSLSAIWVQSKEPERFSRLMGTSLALYMTGMSLSPTIVTLLPSFFLSFIVAIVILGLSLLYLLVFVPSDWSTTDETAESISKATPNAVKRGKSSILEPIYFFGKEPVALFPGFAVFFYNAAQAYLFPAIMVHAALKFGFTSIQNGYVVSIAATTSSVYLFLILYALPKIRNTMKTEQREVSATAQQDNNNVHTSGRRQQFSRDFVCALVSMSVQLIVLPCFGIANTSQVIYGLAVLVALGLAAPSFIKSYGVHVVEDKEGGLAGFAFMESTGGLLAPILLGSSQSLLGEGDVFIVASALVGIAILSLSGSLLVRI